MDARLVEEELQRRISWWAKLQEARDGPSQVAPGLLRALRVSGGQRGIWVDKPRTGALTDDGVGVAVAFLHTGVFYQDELADDGVIYHYPHTEVPGWDHNQIEAAKNAARLGVPVFVITASPSGRGLKNVRLGWVDAWDDTSEQFLVTFREEPPSDERSAEGETPFVMIERGGTRRVVSRQRVGQAGFRFRVMHRYGPRCVLCDLAIQQALDTPHIVPVARSGTNDPRNGLVMCATHHRAFDSHLFGIEPESLAIQCRPKGPDVSDLRISVGSLAGLSKPPHRDALSWRWDHWRRQAKTAPRRSQCSDAGSSLSRRQRMT